MDGVFDVGASAEMNYSVEFVNVFGARIRLDSTAPITVDPSGNPPRYVVARTYGIMDIYQDGVHKKRLFECDGVSIPISRDPDGGKN